MSDILRWQKIKTRKPHICFGCGQKYPAGTMMTSAAYADSGTVDGCYWCQTCEEYMSRYFEFGDETGYGEIRSNDREGWEALKKELEEGGKK